jgi:hypothetical protein
VSEVEVALVGGGEDAGQDRDAHRAADLPGQVVERRGDTLLGGGQGRGDVAGGRGHGQAHADAQGDQPDGEEPVAAGAGELGQDDQGRSDQRQPCGAYRPGPEPVHQRGGQPGGGQHRGGHGQHADRRDQPRVAPDELQVLQDDKDEAEEGEKLHEDRQAASGQGRAGENPGIDHRGAAAELPSDEADQDHKACGQAGQGASGQPPLAGRLDDRVHERDQADHGQDGAADVKARGVGVG